MKWFNRLILFVSAALFLVLGPSADAAFLNPGDVVISTFNTETLVLVDPVTGVQQQILSGGDLASGGPSGIAATPDGTLYILNQLGSSAPEIIKATFDSGGTPTTSILASGGPMVQPRDIELDAAGNLIIGDRGAGAQIIRVNPVTGAQTVVSSGGSITDPLSIAIQPSTGDIFAGLFTGSILRIDPVSGSQSVFASGNVSGVNIQGPSGMAFDANGDLVVSDLTNDSVYRIDATDSNNRTLIASGGVLDTLTALDIAEDGMILTVGSGGTDASIFEVHPITGAVTTLTSGAPFLGSTDSNGFVIIPQFAPVPEPSTLALSALGLVLVARRRRRSGAGNR